MEYTIGQRIKGLRKARGLTAAQLAGRVGVTENAIRKIESGSSQEPRFSVALRIAETLGTTPMGLIGSVAMRGSSGPPQLARVIRDIRSRREDLTREGVENVAVFGSVVRDEASPRSDVDVIVYPHPGFTLFNLVSVKKILEDAIGHPVDAMTCKSLERTTFAATAQAEAVNVL